MSLEALWDHPVVQIAPDGRIMANTWQGNFPWQNLQLGGYVSTEPVVSFPPNGFGLYDMSGDVGLWTEDWYQEHGKMIKHACCSVDNPICHLGSRGIVRLGT